MSHETYIPAFPPGKSPHPSPYISYGTPYPSACAHHVASTFHARRVYILASGSLSRNTNDLPTLVAALEAKLGPGAVVGITKGIKPHTHYSDILAITHEAKAANADILVTLGGGSLTDAAKVVALALANDATTLDALESLYFDSPTLRDPLLPAVLPIICIPTSLSAGEYTPLAGATNDLTHHKHSFQHLSLGPRLIILSPELSTTTPLPIWLSSGVRAIDHCIEAICSIAPTAESTANATSALRRLVPGLLATKSNPHLLPPRMQCLLGAKDAISCGLLRVPMGASHGIGHQLGPLGVAHGDTSCVLLPAVLRFNKAVNAEQQDVVLDVLWGMQCVRDVMGKGGVRDRGADLADVLDALLRALGVPRSLREVGVGREALRGLALGSLSDRWVRSNPVPLRESGQVLEILEMVVGGE
ncbi:hypothetical protein IMSHALPRED_010400 [Imshaugia aleurites]|uniref:Alcohol dehydrogenase iron-type/glycerol dehydrogenase GldA domain-containing protein n=1 Tax=Imshaugia aleurites TaxID=172621 RepID=A0A8H3G3D7_9LECA|nr:hypothetical protein IMSHALPRED_010400 [Imshaugia aleurites]